MLIKIFPLSIRFILGAFFIFSALSKLYPVEPFEYYIVENNLSNWFWSPYLTRVVIAWELFLGVCLAFNIYLQKIILKATLVTLILFSVFILYLIITKGSDADCGCFGDALKMGAWPSLFKNIGLIISIVLLMIIDNSFIALNKWWIILLAFITSFATPFILNVPENYSLKENSLRDNFNLGKDFSTLLNANNIEIVDKQIVVFFSSGCSHCKMAAKKIKVMQQKNQINSPFHVFMFGDSDGANAFFNETGTSFEYTLINENDFFSASGPVLPSLYELKNGKVTKHASGGYFNPYLFEQND